MLYDVLDTEGAWPVGCPTAPQSKDYCLIFILIHSHSQKLEDL